MNYQQTLTYLFERLPMYQRIGAAAYKVDLSNTHLLCELLDNPHQKFKAIHIAGTNGKGSTSHMVASVLQEAGYKVGLYTSPHLKDFRERIKVNGQMIAEKEVISFVGKYKKQFESINLSFFEWTVGLAFSYFAAQKVDISIVETGLGGRLDSTNVIVPQIAVITNIGIDHTQFLGNTLQAIAKEKAGIIKAEIPVIIGESQIETATVFNEKAQEMNAEITFADKEISYSYQSDLKGVYQQKNSKTCIATIHGLTKKGWNISEQNMTDGLLNVVKNTNLLGRWQTLQKSPRVICDIGHNEAGIKAVIEQLKLEKYNKLHVVFGTVNDKNIDKILDLLLKTATYYFCKANIPRALDVEELLKMGLQKGLRGDKFNSVPTALQMANKNATKEDLILVGGSNFVVAEVV